VCEVTWKVLICFQWDLEKTKGVFVWHMCKVVGSDSVEWSEQLRVVLQSQLRNTSSVLARKKIEWGRWLLHESIFVVYNDHI